MTTFNKDINYITANYYLPSVAPASIGMEYYLTAAELRNFKDAGATTEG